MQQLSIHRLVLLIGIVSQDHRSIFQLEGLVYGVWHIYNTFDDEWTYSKPPSLTRKQQKPRKNLWFPIKLCGKKRSFCHKMHFRSGKLLLAIINIIGKETHWKVERVNREVFLIPCWPRRGHMGRSIRISSPVWKTFTCRWCQARVV